MQGEGNSELVAMFTSRWSPEAPTSPKGQLRVALAGAARAGAAAWPEVDLWSERFVGYLTERADPSLPPLEAIAQLHIGDLYLACACAGGDPAGTEAFVRLHGPGLRAVVGQVDATPAFIDEVMEELRLALLTDEAALGREGKLAQYRGRVPLGEWLAASARRRALTLKGSAKPFDDLASVAAMERATPPVDHLRLRYPNGFGQTVTDGAQQGLASLTSNDRTLLRSHLVEGFSLRKLAHIRGVNVNTVARDFANARAVLQRHIRQALATRTGLPPEDVAAVMGALFTRINLGIAATLKGAPRT
jgi:RNA polymerase sigma-70 factor (ECF subfamily)